VDRETVIGVREYYVEWRLWQSYECIRCTGREQLCSAHIGYLECSAVIVLPLSSEYTDSEGKW